MPGRPIRSASRRAGGEAGAALLRRVREVFEELREAAEDCAAVTHGGPLKLLLPLLLGTVPDLLAPAPALGSVQVVMA